MAKIKRFQTNQRMSQRVVHGDLVWLAGQCGRAFDSIEDQTREALTKIDQLLAGAGSNKKLLLSTTIWLADIADYDAMNAVWDDWVPNGCAPARACGETKLGGEGYAVEVICVASKAVSEDNDK